MSKRTTPRPVDPAHVAVRAYFLWLNGGATHGHDVDDWHAAEATQRRSDAAKAGVAARARRDAYTRDMHAMAATRHALQVYTAGLPSHH